MIFLAAAEAVRVSEPTSITSLGVGGIFALLIIREFVAYSRGKKTTNGFQKTAICDEIVKRLDKNIESHDSRFDKIDKNLEVVKTLIRNGN